MTSKKYAVCSNTKLNFKILDNLEKRTEDGHGLIPFEITLVQRRGCEFARWCRSATAVLSDTLFDNFAVWPKILILSFQTYRSLLMPHRDEHVCCVSSFSPLKHLVMHELIMGGSCWHNASNPLLHCPYSARCVPDELVTNQGACAWKFHWNANLCARARTYTST